jgi:hypothetical protein
MKTCYKTIIDQMVHRMGGLGFWIPRSPQPALDATVIGSEPGVSAHVWKMCVLLTVEAIPLLVNMRVLSIRPEDLLPFHLSPYIFINFLSQIKLQFSLYLSSSPPFMMGLPLHTTVVVKVLIILLLFPAKFQQ